jgi:hypothetical protein
MSNVGLAKFYDPESGETLWVDTGSAEVRKMVDRRFEEHGKELDQTMRRYGVDMTTLWTGEDFVKPLRGLFAKRS